MSSRARHQTFNTRAPASLEDITGLDFPTNATAGSDVRLTWTGADILPRNNHTAIWTAKYVQQTGYYANLWHCHNGAFAGAEYDFGTHPFPCDGAFDGQNKATGGTSDTGIVHYYEIATVGESVDYIGGVTAESYLVTKGVWVTSARSSEVVGANLRHRYWPDISQPTKYIEVTRVLANMNTPASPVFLIGCSPWRADSPSAGQNDETPGGILRGFKLFSASLSITDIASEAASTSNTPQTAAGIASVWYMNVNPTPSDVTDKSGAGHHPAWANANRPSLVTL
jgi:hypothetical protein